MKAFLYSNLQKFPAYGAESKWMSEEILEIEPLQAPVSGKLCSLGVHYPKVPASAGKDKAVGNTGQEGLIPTVERPVAYPYAAPGAILASIFPDQTTP